MPRRYFNQRRAFFMAFVANMRTAWGESAADRRLNKVWRLTLDGLEAGLAGFIEPRHRCQQSFGVGVRRVFINFMR